MEDVKKNIAKLFGNSRSNKRYAPRNKRPPFRGVIVKPENKGNMFSGFTYSQQGSNIPFISLHDYISLDFLDRVVEDDLQENEYIPLNILEKPIVLSPDAKKNEDEHVSPDISDYVSLDILDRVIYSQNHSARNNEEKKHTPLDILDKAIDSETRSRGKRKAQKSHDEGYTSLDMLGKKPRKEKCEHLSPVMDCFAGGFGHIRCFEPEFHEACRFKLNHKRMIEERKQIRKSMEKFENA